MKKNKEDIKYIIGVVLALTLILSGVVVGASFIALSFQGEIAYIDTYVTKLERNTKIENNLLYNTRYVYTDYYYREHQVVIQVEEETYIRLEVGYKIKLRSSNFSYISCYNFN